ncbi:MAG: glycosyltransferase, partial [Turicibacter sp.]
LGFSQYIKEIIDISDIGLLLYYWVGLPRSVMELMCFKKPVIGTNIRGNRDLISHGETGYLVEVGDYQKTAEYIKHLFLNKVLVRDLGEKAAERMNSFTIDKVLSQLDEIIFQEDLNGAEIKD